MLLLQDEGRQKPQDMTVARRAREDAALQELGLDLLRRPGRAQPEKETFTLARAHGTYDARTANVVRHAAHVGQQILRLDGLDHRLDGRAGHRAAAVSRAEQPYSQTGRS